MFPKASGLSLALAAVPAAFRHDERRSHPEMLVFGGIEGQIHQFAVQWRQIARSDDAALQLRVPQLFVTDP